MLEALCVVCRKKRSIFGQKEKMGEYTMANTNWKAEMPAFREKAAAFYAGEVKAGEYKGFSGKYGSYAQKGGKLSMLRLRMAGGRLTKERLAYIVDSIAKYQVTKVHATTCQTIQLHDLGLEAVCDIMEGALDHNIIPMGGGGDFPRNIMCSPLSGVEQGEYFDVLPYAEAAGEYLLGFVNGEKMPRKLKVCFSSSPSNMPHATFRDLGFVAREDGKFDVYIAGGLGNNPKFGLKAAEGVDPSQVLVYVTAMRNTFIAHGNYEQRGKARTRYMQDTLGAEGLVKEFLQKVQEAEASGQVPELQIQAPVVSKQGSGAAPADKRVIAQKQEGLYTVCYHPIGGMIPPEKLGQIYEAIRDMEETEIRLAPDETMYVINLTGPEAAAVLQVTEDGAKTEFDYSVSCIGSTICQVGLRDSNGLLHTCVEAVREAGIPDGALPRIHISGCPSSCGTHQIGAIGFNGSTKRTEDGPQPAFMLHLGGNDRQGQERMGEQLGAVLQKDVPAFLIEVGQAVAASGQSFAEWIADDSAFRQIAEKYI